jgi:mono/diheme cytochrome c family protein
MAVVTVLFLSASACTRDGTRPSAEPAPNPAERFSEQSGAALYASVCQDCHMADGKGAIGAGRYSALAANPKLEVAGYPLMLVLHGQGGMPPVGKMMSNAQVAMVVNYVRTHFGNAYGDTVKPEDAAALR